MSLPKAKMEIAGKCSQCDYSTIKVFGKKIWSFCVNPKCPSKTKKAGGHAQQQAPPAAQEPPAGPEEPGEE